MRALYSTLFWLFLGASSLVLFPLAALLCAVTAPFDRRRRALHQFTCFWASLYTWLNPAWPVRINGKPITVTTPPGLGQHSEEVLEKWLGFSSADAAALKKEGIIS